MNWIHRFLPRRPDVATATPRLPLLGLMRVGTNVTRAVLEAHYQVQVDYNRLGWKHGPIPSLAPGCEWHYPAEAPLVIVKHPVAVLHSLRGYAQKWGRNLRLADDNGLPGLIRGRMVYCCSELPLRPEYRFANPVQWWNDIVWNHLRFAQQAGGMVLRYEDLLADPGGACARVAAHFQLAERPGSGPAQLPEQAARRMNDTPGKQRQRYLSEESFDKTAFFLQGGYFADFLPDDLSFIEAELDAELMAELGYHCRAAPTPPAMS